MKHYEYALLLGSLLYFGSMAMVIFLNPSGLNQYISIFSYSIVGVYFIDYGCNKDNRPKIFTFA